MLFMSEFCRRLVRVHSRLPSAIFGSLSIRCHQCCDSVVPSPTQQQQQINNMSNEQEPTKNDDSTDEHHVRMSAWRASKCIR